MRVLFVGAIGETNSNNKGYGNAASGMLYVMQKMMKEGRGITALDTFDILSRNLSVPDKDPDIAICMVHPDSFLKPTAAIGRLIDLLKRSKRRYLSVVWETTPLPKRWNSIFQSNLFDGFLAPSYYMGQEIESMVKDKPVFYYPHFIPTNRAVPRDLEKCKEESMFNVLYVGQLTKRKGFEDAILAFTRALGGKEDASLILKYHRMSNKEIDPVTSISSIVATNSTSPKARIYTIEAGLGDSEMQGLYAGSSLLFSPSRGEGFGLPLAEAMVAGLPVVYTGWSAMPEVARAPGNIEVSYTLDEAAGMVQYGYDIGLKYAVPDISSCMDALREMYTLWKTDRHCYYSNVSYNIRLIEERFGYKPVSDCIMHIMENKEGFAPEHIDRNMGALLEPTTGSSEEAVYKGR